MKKKDYERLERIFSYNNVMNRDLKKIGEELDNLYFEIVKKQDFLNYLKTEYIPFLGQRKQFYLDNYPSGGRTTLIRVFLNDVINALIDWIEEKQVFFDYPDGIITINPDLDDTEQQKFIEEKIPGKVYALVYIMDCFANGEKPLTGHKKKLISELNRKFKTDKGESIYSRYKEIFVFDFNKESTFIEIAGEQWRKILFELSENPNQLEQYLKDKKLIFKIVQK